MSVAETNNPNPSVSCEPERDNKNNSLSRNLSDNFRSAEETQTVAKEDLELDAKYLPDISDDTLSLGNSSLYPVLTSAIGKTSPTSQDVANAYELLRSVVRKTPLEHSLRLSSIVEREVIIKREDLQMCRSYKVRGAYNAMASLNEEEKSKGVVAASAGNHAQGVAFACEQLAVEGKIFLPSITPRQKRNRIEAIGGAWVEQIVGGNIFDECVSAANLEAKATGATYIAPFDDPRTVAGQGTVAVEILQQCQENRPAAVVVPVGGGGLIAGVALWLRSQLPDVEIIGVEPEGAASMTAALKVGSPVTLPEVDGFVDGTAVARVGNITFDIVRNLVDQVITVPEGAVCTEMLGIYQVDGIIVEPAGALASTAVALGIVNPKNPGPIVCIISGGNNDISRYDEIIERSAVHEGIRHYFIVRFPQEPGALRHFLDEVLGEDEDIVLFEYTKKNNRETGPALVGLEIASPQDLPALLERMEASHLEIEKVDPQSAVAGLII